MKRLLILLTLLAQPVLAGTHTWSGAGGNSLWSNAANWSSGGAPAATESAPVRLIFPAAASAFTSTPNISGLTVDFLDISQPAAQSYLFRFGGTSTILSSAIGTNLLARGAAGTVRWEAPLTLAATCRIEVGSGQRLHVSGIVTGAGGMVKNGEGTLTLAAANTFAGTLRVRYGTVEADHSSALGSVNGGTEVSAGATLRLGRDTTALTFPAGESLTLAGTLDAAADVTVAGTITAQESPVITLRAGCILTHAGVLTGTPGELRFAGAGWMVLADGGVNSCRGVMAVADTAVLYLDKTAGNAVTGPLRFFSPTASVRLLRDEQIADDAEIQFGNGGIFDPGNHTETLAAFTGAGGELRLHEGLVTVQCQGSAQCGSVGGPLRISGEIRGRLRKTGAGVWKVHAATVSGAQNLSRLVLAEGGLELHGEWAGTLDVEGGLLQGGETQTGLLRCTGGQVMLSGFSAGGFTGKQIGGTVAALLDEATAASGLHQLRVNGAVDLTGVTLQTALNFLPMTHSLFTLLDNDGTDPIAGTFAGLPEGAALSLNGQPFTITYRGGDGNDAVLHFAGIGTPGPEIVAITAAGANLIRLRLRWLPGRKVYLQHSPDMIPRVHDGAVWQDHGPFLFDAAGNAEVLWPTGGAPRGFFRLHTRPPA